MVRVALLRNARTMSVGALALFLVATSACSSHNPSATSPRGHEREVVDLRPLPGFGDVGGGALLVVHTSRAGRVFRSEAEWVSYWKEIIQYSDPVPALPAVDFEHEVVLLALMGRQPSSGYSVAMDSLIVEGDSATVFANGVTPGKGCGVFAAVSCPWVGKVVPNRNARWVFSWAYNRRDCEHVGG